MLKSPTVLRCGRSPGDQRSPTPPELGTGRIAQPPAPARVRRYPLLVLIMSEMASQLHEECRTNGDLDLAESMSTIMKFVESWWSEPLLPWFTDHGCAHSARVADYALTIADVPSLTTDVRLSTLERYILWASSWLHDLGMQTLPGVALGAMAPTDFDRVRHEHPDQSANEVLERADEVGLPRGDDPLRQIVAYVARAHGTQYYLPSVRFLEGFPSVRNQEVRGPLLAATLLMADELDLHYQRARILPPSFNVLSDVAEAHAFKHRQVLDCGVQHTASGVVELHMTMQRAPGVTDATLAEVERWITDKLRRQIALTEVEFIGGFKGRASMSRHIKISRVESLRGDVEPTQTVSAVILADNADNALIDHRSALRTGRDALQAGEVVLIEGAAEATIDSDGREDLARALARHAQNHGARLVECHCLFESEGAATAGDAVTQLLGSLTGLQTRPCAGQADRESTLRALVDSVSAIDGRAVLVISSVDRLPRREREWILGKVLPELQEAGEVSVVMTCSPGLLLGVSRQPSSMPRSWTWTRCPIIWRVGCRGTSRRTLLLVPCLTRGTSASY